MFEGDSADTCTGKFPLMVIGGQVNGQACADGERGPPSARAEIYFCPVCARKFVNRNVYWYYANQISWDSYSVDNLIGKFISVKIWLSFPTPSPEAEQWWNISHRSLNDKTTLTYLEQLGLRKDVKRWWHDLWLIIRGPFLNCGCAWQRRWNLQADALLDLLESVFPRRVLFSLF